MIRKLLCLLGWHEYQRVEMIKYTNKGIDIIESANIENKNLFIEFANYLLKRNN